jgi:hypothetical protein
MKYFLAITALLFGFSAVTLACPATDDKEQKQEQKLN